MSFISKRKKQLGIRSLADILREDGLTVKDPANYVHGPEHYDCLEDKWSKGEVLGLVGGSGSGKTAICFEMFEGVLRNTVDRDSVAVFVSLEMTTQRIMKRWVDLVGKTSPLLDRLYIISNYNDDGTPKNLTTESIKMELRNLKAALGVEIDVVGLDHLHLIQPCKKTGEDCNKMCAEFKSLAVELDCFGILLSQTTKGKSGSYCDKPLDADASFNCSQFKWISSYVITIHQPIAMLDDCDLNVLAWNYSKVREKAKGDRVKPGQFNLLSYDMDTGSLSNLSFEDMIRFNSYFDEVKRIKAESNDGEVIGMYNTKVSGKEVAGGRE